MRTTPFGPDAIEMPVIGLGTAEYLGGVGPINAAFDAGVRLIDTAESYGTEQQLGAAMAGRREDAFVATKVSAANFHPEDMAAAIERSLRALQSEYVDLYQLHWPSKTVPLADTLGAMDALVDAGKVRHIGVCNFSLALLKEAQALTRHGIQSNQLPHSPTQPAWESGMSEWCQANGIALIAYSPLSQGMETLTASPAGSALQRWATRLDMSLAQIALAWCVAKPGVIAIPKSRARDRVVENANAGSLELPSDALAEINAAVSSVSDSSD